MLLHHRIDGWCFFGIIQPKSLEHHKMAYEVEK